MIPEKKDTCGVTVRGQRSRLDWLIVYPDFILLSCNILEWSRSAMWSERMSRMSVDPNVVCKHGSEVLLLLDRVVVVVVAVLRAGCRRQLDTTERRQHLRPAQADCSDGGRRPGWGSRRTGGNPHRCKKKRLGGRSKTPRWRYTMHAMDGQF